MINFFQNIKNWWLRRLVWRRYRRSLLKVVRQAKLYDEVSVAVPKEWWNTEAVEAGDVYDSFRETCRMNPKISNLHRDVTNKGYEVLMIAGLDTTNGQFARLSTSCVPEVSVLQNLNPFKFYYIYYFK